MLSRPRHQVLLVAAFSLALPRVAAAVLPHPASWKAVSSDGRYVLVMVSPLPVKQDAGHSAFDQSEILQIRSKYTQSGLYRNDGSTEPLWTIEYRGSMDSVHIAPDGKHVILGDKDWLPSWGHVVSFYANGKRLAWYRDQELIYCFLTKGVCNNLLGRDFSACEEAHFDAQALTYTMKTNQGEVFTFDVTTGRLIRHSSPWLFYVGVPLILIPILVVAIWYRQPFLAAFRRCSQSADPQALEETGGGERHVARRWRLQFTLREALVAVALVCLFFGLNEFRPPLVIPYLLVVAAGGLARLWSGTGRSWLIGAIAGAYLGCAGFVLGGILFEAFHEADLLRPWVFLVPPLVGFLAGGLLVGIVERRYASRHRSGG